MYEDECPVCGEKHGEDEWSDLHTLICLYQPSLHTVEEFCEIAIDECDYISGEPTKYTEESLAEFGEEIMEEAQEKLPEGYVAVSDDDYWAIWQV